MRIYIILLICSFSFADYLGGYPGSGFRYSTNARQMALGNSIISEYNQGFNAFSNPALLSKTKKYDVVFLQHYQFFSILSLVDW